MRKQLQHSTRSEIPTSIDRNNRIESSRPHLRGSHSSRLTILSAYRLPRHVVNEIFAVKQQLEELVNEIRVSPESVSECDFEIFCRGGGIATTRQ